MVRRAMSLFHRHRRRETCRLPEPSPHESLEDFAVRLSLAGAGEMEGAMALSAAAKQGVFRYPDAPGRHRDILTDLSDAQAARIEPVVGKWWSLLSWAYTGSPDASGPFVPEAPIRQPARLRPGDPGWAESLDHNKTR